VVTTVSAFQARLGGYVGEGGVHPAVIDAVRTCVSAAREDGRVRDAYVARCGGGAAILLAHEHPPGAGPAQDCARSALARGREVASDLGQHEAGSRCTTQVAEIELAERDSEPLLFFASWGAPQAAFDVLLYRIFADPLNSPSLIGGTGFDFEVSDARAVPPPSFSLPAQAYELLAELRSAGSGAVISRVALRADGSTAAAASTGADPVALVRSSGRLPAVAEALEAFASAPGACTPPLMPVAANEDVSGRARGPARVIGLGFQLSRARLIGPRDLFADRGFEAARRLALTLSSEASVLDRSPRLG
jgi:fructose 1,6-bisphosphate aldolase/phosphatase